jgi:PHP family Zn ribbon phosphoesterase
VEVLADRAPGYQPPGAPPFRSAIPLNEILAEARGVGVASKWVREEYLRMAALLGNEFSILFERSLDDIARAASPIVAEAVNRMRSGKVSIRPGYDGEYGRVRIFDAAERGNVKGQGLLL